MSARRTRSQKKAWRPFTQPFPHDLIRHVCSVLHAQDDREALQTLQLVSHACWKAATPFLYRNVTLRSLDDLIRLLRPILVAQLAVKSKTSFSRRVTRMIGTYNDIEALKPDIKRLITALRATESIEVASPAVVHIVPAMLILRQLTIRFPDQGILDRYRLINISGPVGGDSPSPNSASVRDLTAAYDINPFVLGAELTPSSISARLRISRVIPDLLRRQSQPSTACYHYSSAIHHFAASFMGTSNFVVLDADSTKTPDTDTDEQWTELIMSFGGVTAHTPIPRWIFLGIAHDLQGQGEERILVEAWRSDMIDHLASAELHGLVEKGIVTELLPRTLKGLRDGSSVEYRPRPTDRVAECPVCGYEY